MKMTQTYISALILVTINTSAFASQYNVGSNSQHLTIDGNVELNFNYRNRESNIDYDDEFNQDGRVLIEFAGSKNTPNGHYIGFKAQPLFRSTGSVSVDDVYLNFGQQNGWSIKVGRYEAYDLFPVGLDVFLEYSGDTSNNLYMGESAYIYQLKEARGRGGDGQIMYSQSVDSFYFEVSSIIGDRSEFFNDSYHGVEVDKDTSKDSFIIRPAIAYQFHDFTIAAGLEQNLIKNAIVDLEGKDISDRTGYGLTLNWSIENLEANTNFAHMQAVDETNSSIGVNMLYHRFGIGYVHAENTYDSSWAKGDVSVGTLYSSFGINDFLSIPDFTVLLGTYFTSVRNRTSNQDAFSEDDDFGARVRLHYQF